MKRKAQAQTVKLTFSIDEMKHIATSASGYGIRLATFIRIVFWRGLDVVNRCGIPNPMAEQTALPLIDDEELIYADGNGKDKKDAQ
jgi:hypothetical protein